jgi:polyadenylate-binding protein
MMQFLRTILRVFVETVVVGFRLREGRVVELIVDALPRWYTEEQLLSLFMSYGSVSSARIVRAPNGQSLGFGYVTMASAEDAGLARQALQDQLVGNRPLVVVPRSRNIAAPEAR